MKHREDGYEEMDNGFNLRDAVHRFRMCNRITKYPHQMPQMRRLLFNKGRGGNIPMDGGTKGNEEVMNRHLINSFRVIFL